jgi:hypothetical protein
MSAVFLLPGHSTDATVNDQPSSAPERHAESVIAYFLGLICKSLL